VVDKPLSPLLLRYSCTDNFPPASAATSALRSARILPILFMLHHIYLYDISLLTHKFGINKGKMYDKVSHMEPMFPERAFELEDMAREIVARSALFSEKPGGKWGPAFVVEEGRKRG
jgi:hypothetical protein